MVLNQRNSVAPVSQHPEGDPTMVWGAPGSSYHVQFWDATSDTPGKITVVSRPDLITPGTQEPPLAAEVAMTLHRMNHDGIKQFYRAVGVDGARQVAADGSVQQEITVPYKPRAVERLAGLGAGIVRMKLFCGDLYSDREFMDTLAGNQSDDGEPEVLTAERGMIAAHDLLTHDLPAWAFAPPEAIKGIGQHSLHLIDGGMDPSDRMEVIDNTMAYGKFGNPVLRWLQLERGYGRGAGSWDQVSDILNGLAGSSVVSSQRVERHVYGVIAAACALE